MKEIKTDELYGFKITEAECTGINRIKVSGTFYTNYSTELGEFNIYNIIIDPTKLATDCGYYDYSNYRAYIDLDISNIYSDVKVPEKPPVKMTVKEIEEKLGFKVEIVSDKE